MSVRPHINLPYYYCLYYVPMIHSNRETCNNLQLIYCERNKAAQPDILDKKPQQQRTSTRNIQINNDRPMLF